LQYLVNNITIGGLVHDLGKVLHRGANGDGRAHSVSGCEWIGKYTTEKDILDCIRYHHHQDIEGADLDAASPAYLVYLADNIASGIDRRQIEGAATAGFDRSRPQESVYNLLNNNNGRAAYRVAAISEKINCPRDTKNYNPAADYNRIIADLNEDLSGINFQGEYINSLLELCEAYLSYIPSSTYRGEVADISLFDHSKITAALAACMALYLDSQQRSDYRTELLTNRHNFYGEKAFCLFSCDISGIQQFIYTISSKGALKGLRSRSFYLELLLENLADEILGACSLYRTNLLYTGGGHAYILLPNTPRARENAAASVASINRRLMEYFGAGLYVAYGLQECSAAELMSKTPDPEDYTNIFRSLSAQIAQRKLRRYSAGELRQLNNTTTDKEGRECSVCGVSSRLEYRGEETYYCGICAAFTDISRMLIKPDSVFVVTRTKLNGTSLPLFSSLGEQLYFHASNAGKIKELLQKSPEQVVRVYSKNTYRTGFSLATKLWLGDYAATSREGDLKTFAELAACSRGIERIGVLRADVDNMGTAFVSGFVRDEAAAADKYKYLTISRTATLSRSLSIFFKYYLNDLLADGGEFDLLAPPKQRNLVVVYSGGDDLFLVGAWNDVLSAAIDIRRSFARYTCNTLTMSAGFAMFEPGYPIARMAEETAWLEERAKGHRYQGKMKNSISLFGLEMDGGQLQARHTYDWDTFENQVLGEKYTLLDSIFSDGEDYGNSFLYNILDLLRQAEKDRINIARLAYLLARREPDRKASGELKRNYSNFSQCVYRWALDENGQDRLQLITAIMLYTYYKREKKEERS
jgi:CRISPR-associated protein Csm1